MSKLCPDSYLRVILLCLTVLVMGLTPSADAEKKVVVKAGQNVRDLAREHLGDPNLWNEILRANGLNSPAEVRAGMTLQLPDETITRANNQLDEAQQMIDQAAKAGAKIFASSTLAEAIQIQNSALARRKNRDWDGCFDLAQKAYRIAEEAYQKSQSRSEVASEAILAEKKGTVQSRKPSETIWTDLPENAVLYEGERVRTLSESFAEVLFKDGSRLRLNENSQAIIRKMRANVLNNQEEASVSLTEGDAFFLLEGNRQQRDFELDVAGASTRVNSSNFWIKADSAGTQVANYDGEIEIKRGSESVVVGKNEVSSFGGDQEQASRRALLPAPTLRNPVADTTFFRSTVTFEWEPVEDAVGYWLEVAVDRIFKRVVLNQRGIRQTNFSQRGFEDGAYYWRVSAMDRRGFPGESVEGQVFSVINDFEPPFLVITSPRPNAIVTSNPVMVQGQVELNATLSHEERPVAIEADGTFTLPVSVEKGSNTITLLATDRAGNTFTVSRRLIYSPDVDVPIRYDSDIPRGSERHFLAPGRFFTLSGETEPANTVSIQQLDGQFFASTVANPDGTFRFAIELAQSFSTYVVAVMSLGGHVTRDTIQVEMDAHPGTIDLASEPPRLVQDAAIHLRGQATQATKVTVNQTETALTDGQFETEITLQPGKNEVTVAAIDPVGHVEYAARQITLDTDPPRRNSTQISPRNVTGGEWVTIMVEVSDQSELRTAAPFTVQIGRDFDFSGYLIYRSHSGRYFGQFQVPANVRGTVKLTHLVLRDVVGNEAVFND